MVASKHKGGQEPVSPVARQVRWFLVRSHEPTNEMAIVLRTELVVAHGFHEMGVLQDEADFVRMHAAVAAGHSVVCSAGFPMADVSLLDRLLQVPGARELRVAVIGGRVGGEEPVDEAGPLYEKSIFLQLLTKLTLCLRTARAVAINRADPSRSLESEQERKVARVAFRYST